MLFISLMVGLVIIGLVLSAFFGWPLFRPKKNRKLLTESPKVSDTFDDVMPLPMQKSSRSFKQAYHSRAADEPPDGQGKRDIEFDHQAQRQEIMAVHNERGDIIEPPSKRQRVTQGHGMGMPPHPLTSVGPQGAAPSLSADASNNPDAQANAEAHPENTPVPTAELHNQAKAQATMGMAPKPGQS